MEPEEIDKLFKDRLAGLPGTPSPDAWLRLQQKMEPPQKERSLWVYYAAASIALLILAGLLVFRNPSLNQNRVALKSTESPAKKNKEIISPSRTTPTPGLASTSETADENNKSEINRAAVEVDKELKKPGNFIKKENEFTIVAKTKKTYLGKVKNSPVPTVNSEKEITPVAAKTTDFNLQKPKTENSFNEENKISAPENIVQVVVKLDDQDLGENKIPEENSFRENLSRKGSLLKNIYKQARNLKNGDPVELTALGINTEKITAEKENIKLKINKVISL